MTRPYETVFIFESTLEDGQVDAKIDRFKQIVSGGDGSAVSANLWGKRTLAYPIGKKEQGIYAVLRYSTDPESLAELERIARLDEQVVRHLTVVNPVEPAGAAAADSEEEE